MARHVLAILSAVHGAGRAHGALHPTAVEVEYEGSERVRLKVLPTCLLCFSWENLAPELQRRPRPGALALPPFLDGNLRCAPRAYPCSGAFASCAVCGGLLLWA